MTITVTVAGAGHGSGGRAQWSDSGYILEVQLSAFAAGFHVGGGEMRKINNNAQALGLSPQTGSTGPWGVSWSPGKLAVEPRPQNPSVLGSLGLVPLPNHLPPTLNRS